MNNEYPLLKRLEESRVFGLEKYGDGFVIGERCDDYFSVALTKEELFALAREIEAFAKA